MIPIEEAFSKAVTKSNELKQRPDNKRLLKLYGVFKESTQGDIAGDRSKGFDFKAAAKYEAWASLKGMSRQEAMRQYVALIEKLAEAP